jgi:hypothetical protein
MQNVAAWDVLKNMGKADAVEAGVKSRMKRRTKNKDTTTLLSR